MSFARSHLQEARRIIDELDVDVIDRMADIIAAARTTGGRLFFLGVGGGAANARTRSTTSARSPDGVLRADRQRVRADRAHQRRRLGTVFAMARRQPPEARGQGLRLFRGRRQPREKCQREHRAGPCNMPKEVGARSWAWWGATAATPPRWATRLHHPDGERGDGDPPFGGLPGGGLAPRRLASGAEGPRDKWEIGEFRRV